MTDYYQLSPGQDLFAALQALDSAEGRGFFRGNVLRYTLRAGRKTTDPLPDLMKGLDTLIRWYMAESGITEPARVFEEYERYRHVAPSQRAQVDTIELHSLAQQLAKYYHVPGQE
jgi:hypothetical protein